MEDVRLLEVVTPAPNQDLVTLADVRDELGAARGQDTRLKRYITSASSIIATHTRRVWREETVIETFYSSYFGGYGYGWGWGWGWQHSHRHDGKPKPLVLARYPVSSITSVWSGADLLDPAGYFVDKDKGLLYQWDGATIMPWTHCANTVAVTYVAGYSLADVPPDVQQAAMTAIRVRYFSHGRDPYLRSINVPGVQEESYWAGPDQSALPPEAVGLLEKHIDMRM
jgi:hypothetical protein